MHNSNRRLILPGRGVSVVGVLMILIGVAGLILGQMLIASLTRDFRASLEVSRSAVATIGDTVETIGEVNDGTNATLRSAAAAASSAAGSTSDAAAGLERLASFMEEDLPEDIEAMNSALPGAIDAADTVDATLSALSLIGVDYAPEEPFGESLRRIERALDGLPEEIRNQGSALGLVVPSSQTMAGDVEILASDLEELASDLAEVDVLGDSYETTVAEAETAIANAGSSLDRTVIFLRIVAILAALGASMIGLALMSIDRRLSDAEFGSDTA